VRVVVAKDAPTARLEVLRAAVEADLAARLDPEGPRDAPVVATLRSLVAQAAPAPPTRRARASRRVSRRC
jgi:hypothetical protein